MLAAGALLVVLAAAAPGAAGGVSSFTTPDAGFLFELRRRHRPGRTLRVTSGAERYLLRARELDERGLVDLTPRRKSLLPPDPFPWSRIERIDIQTSRTTYGRIMGAIVGGLGGLLVPAFPDGYRTDRPTSERDWFLGGAVVGAVAGGALGSRVMREHSFYVAPSVPFEPRVAASTPVTPPTASAPASVDSAGPPAPANPIVAAPDPAAAPVTVSGALDVNTAPKFEDPDVSRALRRIGSGDLLRIDSKFGLFHGYASRLGPGGLAGLRAEPSLESIAGQRSLTWAEIDRIQRRGGNAGQGAIRGAVVVGSATGVLGVLVLLAVASAANGAATTGEVAGVAVAATGIGAAVGALFGAGIGAAIPGWHTVYVRR